MVRPAAMVRATALAVCLLALASTACTSVGVHSARARAQVDFGRPQTVALCLLVDEGIGETEARALVHEAWRKEGALYGLTFAVARVTPWRHPAFSMDGLLEAVRRAPLQPPCDRVMALVGRRLGDALWGLAGLPAVLGAVDDTTLTHGYVVARRASLSQLVSPPATVLRHELYHMLGCDEHFNMPRCYEQIARLKRWRAERGSGFFPGWDAAEGRVVPTRAEVNARLSGTAAGALALPRDGAWGQPDPARSTR